MARFLITCGPTREPLDPVRYLSNASSGRTGLAIARESLERGHEVDLILGPVDLHPPPEARVVRVSTCAEMLEACLESHPDCQALIGCAAVCDFKPAAALSSKRPRGGGAWMLELVPNPDILGKLGTQKGQRIHAGFALECEDDATLALEKAREKLRSKNLDWIVLNGPEALGGEEGSYTLLGRSGPPEHLGRLDKRGLARRLIAAIENSLKDSRPPSDKNR